MTGNCYPDPYESGYEPLHDDSQPEVSIIGLSEWQYNALQVKHVPSAPSVEYHN